MNIHDFKIQKFQGREQTNGKERALTGLGYIPILFFLPLVLKPATRAGRHCANQGITMLALVILVAIVKSILNVVAIVRIFTNIALNIAQAALWVGSVARWYLYFQNDTQTELPYSLNLFK